MPLDQYGYEERFANAFTMTLNKDDYNELVESIEVFSRKVQENILQQKQPGNRLYQLTINLSPTGGSSEED